MTQRFLLLVAVLLSFTLADAQEVEREESWSGKMMVGASELDICFVIKSAPDGSQSGVMNVPAQGVKDMPVSLLKNGADSLIVSIPKLMDFYKGEKVSPDSIRGTFVQSGMVLPLDLRPGGIELRRPQTPVPPFAYVTEEVSFRNEAEGAVLAGTLTYPVGYKKSRRKSVPVVLLVTGSGAQDRDETIFEHKPFLVIADYLAKHGIASLRYDDRGVGKSTGPVENTTTLNNLLDAEAGISYLRSLKRFGKVGVLGHSEGGTIAFMMGANRDVDFLISLAGGAAEGIDVLVGQNKALMMLQGFSPKVVDDYAAALRILYTDRINGKKITDTHQYVADLCKENKLTIPYAFKANLEKCVTFGGDWLTWFLGFNPADAICNITCPAMAVNGNLDMQVLGEDNMSVVKAYLPANNKNIIKEYEGLNHLFQHCTPATALNYGAIEETISGDVLEDIVKFVGSIAK